MFVPRVFHPGEDTFDDRFRFVGPCLRAGADAVGWVPPSSGRPVVLVSLGTLSYEDSADLMRRVVAAVVGIGGHAVVSLGDVDPEGLGEIGVLGSTSSCTVASPSSPCCATPPRSSRTPA